MSTRDKVLFVVSGAVLVWLFGFATSARQWFPNDHLVELFNTVEEIRAIVGEDTHPATHNRVYYRSGARTLDSTQTQEGLTLVPSVWQTFDWKPGLKLIDADGRVVHKWNVNPARIFTREFSGLFTGLSEFNQPHGAYLFPNGDVLVVFSRVGTARLDGCGRVKWTVRAAHHHSVTRGDDGTFWISASDSVRTADPFTNSGSDRHDRIVRLSQNGEVIRSIEIFDVLRENPELLQRYFRFHHPEDTHLNDVEPLSSSIADEYPLFEGGDLLVSLKHLNVVFVMDTATLEVKWWEGETFLQQHDPDFVGDGWIGVFDNNEDGTARGSRFGGSRIVGLQPHTDSMEVWFASSPSEPVYTRNRGNWQLLENGNFLLTESNAGRIIEVSPEGQVVWEWVQAAFKEDRVPRIYWAERYGISVEEMVDWPCAEGNSPSPQERINS